jgi:hypothetical protein
MSGGMSGSGGCWKFRYKFAPDGTPTIFVGPAAFGPTQFPVGLAFDRFGNLFVSTEGTFGSPSLDVIFKFTPEGTREHVCNEH